MRDRLRKVRLRGLAVSAMCLGAFCAPAAFAQDAVTEQAGAFPVIELDPQQQERLDGLLEAANAIDKMVDPRAYRAAYGAVVDYAATIYPDPHPELEKLKGELAFTYFIMGEIEPLAGLLGTAIDIYAAAGPQYRQDYIENTNNLAVVMQALGRNDEALEYQRRAVDLWREDAPEGTPALVTGLNNLAWSERGQGNIDRALELGDEALEIGERLLAADPGNAELHDALAVNANNRIYTLIEAGRRSEGEQVLRAALVRFGPLMGPDHPRLATIMLNGSNLLLRSGQLAESEGLARRALVIREEAFGPESPAAAEARLNLIAALTAQHRAADTLPLAEYTARVLTESQGATAPQTLEARLKLAGILISLDRVDEGLAEYRAVLDFFRANRPQGHYDRQYYLQMLALQLGRVNRWAEALPLLAELDEGFADRPEQFSSAAQEGQALRALAEARAGDAALARRLLDETVPHLLATWRGQVEGEGAGGGRDGDIELALGWAMLAAGDLGDGALAFDLAQYKGIGASERSLLRAVQRDEAGDPAVAAALRVRQDLLERREAALASFQRAALAGDQGAMAAIEASISELSEELARQGDLAAPLLRPVGLAEMQQRLGADAALLFIVEADVQTRIFAVTSDGVVADDAGLSTLEIGELVTRLRTNLDAGLAGLAPFDSEASEVLHDALFTPAIRAVLDSKSRVNVIARGELARLPLSILKESGAAGRFALERHAFAYPIDPARAGRSDAGQWERSYDRFVGVGAPALPDAALPTATTTLAFRGPDNARRIADLGPLGLAAGELAAMARAVDAGESRILAGPEATEAALGSLGLDSADIITFATHGLMAGELDGLEEAALVLSPPLPGEAGDGLLTTSEIAALNLTARWVVLSACNSASGNSMDDAAFGGLAQAFLYAGAQSLLASHWRVRDDVAARLSVATAEGAARGLDPAEALRQAKLALIADASVDGAAHPAIWAPFVFVGG
ncbi:CHAT domain-containing protein [Altererythrobacter sp. KTW20L]|uniref:CHAT domain-containing tetratricopeptide repeat protein n=1 Tax=Altererythrobacter sp. KTW20L TaxID=2942210 RepID=UPI0020C17218|nr:CHAT domain-containing protein [Altererythrobacter sp. KTW20L]MCL6249836.1 CHAT domain-containing protein [Altererythrobacter sp. KTW20L]